MTLRDLKELINQIPEQELDLPLIYNSNEYEISGKVQGFKKADEHLYYTGDDDPASLYTKQELLDDGFDEEDISNFDIEIPKDRYYISF